MQSLVTLLHGMSWGWNLWTVLSLASDLLALATAPSILLRRRSQPLPALGWLLAVFALPLVGAGWWWMVGRSKLERRRRDRQGARADLCALAEPEAGGRLACCDESGEAGPAPWRRGGTTRLVVDGPAVYGAFDQLIEGAGSSLELMFYIWRDDRSGRRFRDLLAARAAEGVEVRVLVDAVGAAGLPRRFWAPLEDAGGHVGRFQPPRLLRRGFDLNLRNHRKLVIADGTRAWVGGLNIGDEHLGAWHDLGVVVEGGTVGDLREVFLDDWFFATDEGRLPDATAAQPDSGGARARVVASGPDEPENSTRATLFDTICEADGRVWLMTPYFAPDLAMLEALCGAARRGADVRVLLPADGFTMGDRLACLASRAYWERLLGSGVRLFLHLRGFAHAKAALFDTTALIGSANYDERSLRLNFELGILVEDDALVESLRRLIARDCEEARELSRDDPDRGGIDALVSSAAHLLSPML